MKKNFPPFCSRPLRAVGLLLISCVYAGLAMAQAYDSSYQSEHYMNRMAAFAAEPADGAGSIVWLGDSITEGGPWATLFPGLPVRNRGISADNTFGVLHRLPDVIRLKPKVLFILIGTNDIARNIPVSRILDNYGQMLQQLRTGLPGTTLVVQSLLPTNADFNKAPQHQNKQKQHWELNLGIKNLADAYGARFLDLTTPFMNKQGKLDVAYTYDGLHLNEAGYQHWKKVITKAKLL